MTKQDKELLERAMLVYLELIAKEEGRSVAECEAAMGEDWNPLENDANAFQLAVVTRLFRGYSRILNECLDQLSGNSAENTRRAITMAACQVYTPEAYRKKAS